ncbi:acyl-CoA thioesterase [Marinobacterium sp. AK62]|uniref:Acyl-CoA thioesterase n=2 Tax=Marinobacterium alkalitolerans TaxID=1542925 RepID=A0ABS3ZEI0_9GAMM|nr:acyl-CoA thioesterase [Marinobacterium alkalitolerans]
MELTSMRELKDFPLQAYDKLRYGDTDRQGHVNNSVFSTFLETGRVEMLYTKGESLVPEGATFVLAKLEVQLIGEILWPGQVDIGSGVLNIGNSSITLYQQLFQNGTCVAKAETVIVQMNEATRKSQPLSPDVKKTLEQYLISV